MIYMKNNKLKTIVNFVYIFQAHSEIWKKVFRKRLNVDTKHRMPFLSELNLANLPKSQ